MSNKGSVTVSGDLISHVRKIFELSLEDNISRKVVRRGINNYSHHALPAYILSVAVVEAFINESFLSSAARAFTNDEVLQIFPREWIEKVEIRTKVLLIPYLLYGRSLERDSQPYQDFSILVKVRNDLVHYKMKGSPPKYIQQFDQRGISLTAGNNETDADYLWIHKISCSEGVRWAHNTACKLITEIVDYDPSPNTSLFTSQNFTPIAKSEVERWLQKHGIDPNSNNT